MSRKYIIAVIIFAVLGIGLSLYLIPDSSDIDTLRAKDESIRSAAVTDADSLYAAGDRSDAVVAGWAENRMNEGKGAEALAALEAHLATQPDHHTSRRVLAQLYQAAGRDADYLAAIETIAKAQPTEARLKELSDVYNYLKRYDDQVTVLRQLIEITAGENPDYYVDLATILTLQEKQAEAAQVIAQLKEKHPTHMSYKLVSLLVNGLINAGDTDKAYQEAKSWLEQQPNADEAGQLANLLHFAGRSDLAMELIRPYTDQITGNSYLLSAYVNAAIGLNETERAYKLLVQLHENSSLPSSLYRSLLELALMENDGETALAVISKLDVTQFTEEDGMSLIILAMNSNRQDVALALAERLSAADYLAEKPALAALVALARRDVDEDAKIEAALRAKLTRTQTLRLAQGCAYADKSACFEQITARFAAFSEMTPRELDEVVNLYIAADRQAQIDEQIVALATEKDSPIIAFAAQKIGASLGDADRLQSWIAQSGLKASTAQLAELFYLANDRRHAQTALVAAQALYEREANARHQEMLVSSLMGTRQYGKALPLLREGREQSVVMEDNYLAALAQLARSNADYRKELADYVLPKMADNAVSNQRKLQFSYMLINSGQKDKALPYVKQYASSERGEWQVLYNQLTARPSKGGAGTVALVDRPRDFRLSMALNDKTDINTRRMLAFSLMEDGFKRDAIAVFYALAENQPADSQEVKDLLYLWGPRLNEEQLGWLVSRANNAANPTDKVKWAELIAGYGDDFALMRYVSAHPQAMSHPSIRQKYFRALVANANADTFDKGMNKWVDTTKDAAALRDYAEVAKAYNFQEAALRALKRAEALEGTNERQLKDMAILNYGRGHYSESKKYIDTYMTDHHGKSQPETNPYEAYFYKAELLRRERKMDAAKEYYRRLVALGQTSAKTVSSQSMYYSAQFHLGNADLARRGFYGLLENDPKNKGLLADFMSVLMEYGHHKEALSVARKYDPKAGGTAATPMVIDSPDVSGVKPYEGGREMRINFNSKLTPKATQHMANAPWVDEVKTGYNSMLIAAKPGYVLRFSPVSATSMAIVPVAQNISAEERLRQQQELRLQILYARLEAETGQTERARTRLQALRKQHPQDAELLGYSANIENSAGNWPQALTMLERAQGLSPYNEDFRVLRRNIQRVHSEHVKVDYNWRRMGDSDERMVGVGGVKRITDRVEIGGSYQYNDVDASGLRRADRNGVISDFSTEKQRAEIYGAYLYENGDRAQVSLFANDDTPGAGAYYAFNNALGRSEALIEYHRPYWDFVQAVTEDATRDRIGGRHIARLGPKTTFSGEASINRYNISELDDAASTGLIRANFIHELRAQQPYLGIGYGFDGEYVIDKEKRRTPANEEYSPFPMTAREIHFLSAIVSHNVTDTTRVDFVGGYAIDRLGDHGPQVEAILTQDITDNVEAQIRGRYGLETRNEDENVTQVGGHLMYKF